MVSICPRCRQRYINDIHSSDFVHICNSGDQTLDTEDKLKKGNWEDYTGSGVVNKFELMQSSPNTLQGTDAAIYGAKDYARNVRGRSTQRFRMRQHEQYLGDTNGNKC